MFEIASNACRCDMKGMHLNPVQMVMLSPYQQIIGMGPAAVPLILAELQRRPDQWFWALESITEENPVSSEIAGSMRLMAEAWVDWGKKQGLLAPLK